MPPEYEVQGRMASCEMLGHKMNDNMRKGYFIR